MTWETHSYSAQSPLANGLFSDLMPYIEVEFSYDQSFFRLLGLMDSGASVSMIDMELAKELGINLNTCEKVKVGGVGGEKTGYKTEVLARIEKPETQFLTEVVIVEDLPFSVLLGQNNFFKQFRIKFEGKNNIFALQKMK